VSSIPMGVCSSDGLVFRMAHMIAPQQEQEYFEWLLREEALDWLSLQESNRDILQQIPEAEGLQDFHSRDLNGDCYV